MQPPPPPTLSPSHQRIRRWLPLWALVIVLSSLSTTYFQRDIWTDEAFSISYTFHPQLQAVLEDIRKNEETPPIYFIALWLWARYLGHEVVTLRILSFLFGALAAVGFSLLARRWLPPVAALLATTFFAGAPLLLLYMGEARAYTLTVLVALFCIAAFEYLLAQPDHPLALVLYTLSGVMLFLTSYFGIALLAAHNLIWIARLRQQAHWQRRLIQWIGIEGGSVLLIAAWVPSLLYQQQIAPAVTVDWSNGVADYYWFALSVLLGAPPAGWLRIIWLLIGTLTWAFTSVALLRSRSLDGGLTLRTFGIPALTLTLFVLVLQVTAPRYLLILLPGTALAIATGYCAIKQVRPRLAHLLLTVLLLCVIGYQLVSGVQRTYVNGWAELTNRVAQAANPTSDVVLLHPPWDVRVFQYYYHGPTLPLLGAANYDDFYAFEDHHMRTTWTLAEALPVTQAYQRVWVFYNQSSHQVPKLPLPYRQLQHWQRGRLELFLYQVDAAP